MTLTSADSYPTPLSWPPAFYEEPKRKGFIGKWFKIPNSNMFDVERGIAEQLLARPKPPGTRWGADPLQMRVGQTVCKALQDVYRWPNDFFIPDDPFDVVTLAPYDDLDYVELFLELTGELAVDLDENSVHDFNSKTLGAFIQWVLDVVQRSNP